jgi:nicotinate-nucleotide adenylyltransferase
MEKPLRVLFGGTFDPVHNGHLYIARFLLSHYPISDIRLIPCHIPVLKPHAQVSVDDRLSMLRIALQNEPACHIDPIEIYREGPSYTLDTLRSYRKAEPDVNLALVVGTDVFTNLNQWYRWQEVLTLAHFILIPRPDPIIPHDILALTQPVENFADLNHPGGGRLFTAHCHPPAISSSQVRRKIAHGEDCSALLPPTVWDYIRQHHLYR